MEMDRYTVLENHARRLDEHTQRGIKHDIDDQLHHIGNINYMRKFIEL